MIFSIYGSKSLVVLLGWPFLIIVIGLPGSPEFDQLFWKLPLVLAVLPNLILLANLPCKILSPEKGSIGSILPFSTKVPPKELSFICGFVLGVLIVEPCYICCGVLVAEFLGLGWDKSGNALCSTVFHRLTTER